MVIKDLPQTEKDRRILLNTIWTYTLDRVLDNLHRFIWIGLTEKLDQSLELFEYQTGLKIQMLHENKNRKCPEPTEEEILKEH